MPRPSRSRHPWDKVIHRHQRASVGGHNIKPIAGTVAEYIHGLWHDVTVRTGREHPTAPWLRRSLELFARWFPPDRGHRLFPRQL